MNSICRKQRVGNYQRIFSSPQAIRLLGIERTSNEKTGKEKNQQVLQKKNLFSKNIDWPCQFMQGSEIIHKAEVNFGLADVAAYTQRHYDLIPIDILGGAEVTDLQGEVHSERQFAYRLKTTFTPTLVFFNGQGQEIFRLQGYYPPYQFRAGLEYAVDGHYQRESFADYLARGEDNPKFDPKELTEEPFFIPPPHNLDRTRIPGERPLAVFFERGECHACDVLHGGPLRDPDIARAVRRLDVVQLDMQGEQPLITPAGRVSSPRDWARALGLFYAPSLLFFDEQGREVLRVDSVVGLYRLQNVLSYINSGAYRSEPSYLRWRASQGH